MMRVRLILIQDPRLRKPSLCVRFNRLVKVRYLFLASVCYVMRVTLSLYDAIVFIRNQLYTPNYEKASSPLVHEGEQRFYYFNIVPIPLAKEV